ncbi:TPA: thioredoxin family protein, partial [Enterococcus faecalis]|nr:thioredoxin family protein [Enterococcus faecalis]
AIAATHAQRYVTEQKTQAGQPIVTKRMTERLANQSAPETNSQQPKEKQSAKVTGKHQWFPESMRQQLSGIFAKLTKKVTLLQFLDASDEKSLELQSFLTEFASLDQKITLETILKDTEPAKELLYGIEKMPSVVLLDAAGNYTGIKFSGIPSGHEVNSLVLAVYNVGSEGQPLEASLQKNILALPKRKIEIFVSLTCHFCPDVVAACQRIASINPHVEAEMVDISLFPELKKEKKIMSVPAMLIDGEQMIFGSKTMTEIIEALA